MKNKIRAFFILLVVFSIVGYFVLRSGPKSPEYALKRLNSAAHQRDISRLEPHVTFKGRIVFNYLTENSAVISDIRSGGDYDLSVVGGRATFTAKEQTEAGLIHADILFEQWAVDGTWRFDDIFIIAIDGTPIGLHVSYMIENPKKTALMLSVIQMGSVVYKLFGVDMQNAVTAE